MPFAFRDVVTVVRAGALPSPDGGDPLPDWGPAATTVAYPGDFQPLASAHSATEDVVGQQRTESTHTAYMPASADVKPTDRLRFQGLDYEVEGVERWRMDGADHHIEVRCYRITGG